MYVCGAEEKKAWTPAEWLRLREHEVALQRVSRKLCWSDNSVWDHQSLYTPLETLMAASSIVPAATMQALMRQP